MCIFICDLFVYRQKLKKRERKRKSWTQQSGVRDVEIECSHGLFVLFEQRRQRIPLIACLLYESCYHFSFIFSFSMLLLFFFLDS